MDQEILKVFFYDVRCAVVMHFSAWSAVYYSYLKCIVYDKLLKPRQSFWITLYVLKVWF